MYRGREKLCEACYVRRYPDGPFPWINDGAWVETGAKKRDKSDGSSEPSR